MRDNCRWCGRKSSEVRLRNSEYEFKGRLNKCKICSASCENKLVKFYKYADTHLVYFGAGLMFSIFVGIMIPLVFHDLIGTTAAVTISLAFIFEFVGAVIFIFPFPTGSTIDLVGAKKGIAGARIIGVLLIILGVVSSVVLLVAKPI